ncbi:hypothetical protein KP509_20G067700 [Ceratopteris richardii]|uniref:Uncharacterized protein n=1 Tax=Ceratopteris richardii TaxID=49495 RepID=A0A8T2SK05_CERRI|nr:hypothetical protein KP509_20G067700 [Ceratopteris richardii]
MVLPFIPAVFNAAKKQTLAAASKERSEILAAAEEIKEWIVDIRHKIHEHPELGFECGDTAELVKATLTELGIFFYDKFFAKTGVVGRIGSGNEPFVALRADMDALPLQELYEWTHMSQNKGVMHACGHDAHTAMLLGAAKLLQERYEKKEFEVK